MPARTERVDILARQHQLPLARALEQRVGQALLSRLQELDHGLDRVPGDQPVHEHRLVLTDRCGVPGPGLPPHSTRISTMQRCATLPLRPLPSFPGRWATGPQRRWCRVKRRTGRHLRILESYCLGSERSQRKDSRVPGALLPNYAIRSGSCHVGGHKVASFLSCDTAKALIVVSVEHFLVLGQH